MNGLPTSALLAWVVLAATGCNVKFPAGVKACGEGPADTRINERGDQDELTGHPLAAAALGNGRALVAFSAQTSDDATGEVVTSEVRIAIVEQETGARVTLCNTANRDRTISTPGAFAFGASVAPVNLTVLGNKAVALAAWTEGAALPNSVVQMRFIDGAGCPLASRFQPYAGPAFTGSIAWSEHRQAVLATLNDERNVYRAWIDSAGPADTVPIAASQGAIYGFPVAAVRSDGSAVAVWADGTGPRAILLDPDGNAQRATGAQTADFPIEMPLIANDVRVLFRLSVATRDDRFAVAVEQRTLNRAIPSRAMIREYALDGRALGSAYLLDATDNSPQSSATAAYASGGSLVAVWDSSAAGGTVGRVFGPGGAARFNTISCDDGRFPIGTRSEFLFGSPSLLISNGRVMVFHNAPGGADPRGSATLMWKDLFEDIWPGPH